MAEAGQIVVRLLGRYDMQPTPADGEFVVEYDPRLEWDLQAGDRTFKLATSFRIEEARGFDSAAEAFRYLQQVCPNEPVRRDGRPNRPLSAFHMEISEARHA